MKPLSQKQANTTRLGQTTTSLSGVASWKIQGTSNPSGTSHFCTWTKSLVQVLMLARAEYRIWKHTATLTPFHPYSGRCMQYTDAKPQFYSAQALIFGKKPKNFTAVCYFGFISAFSYLNSVATDIRYVTHKWRMVLSTTVSLSRGFKDSSDDMMGF